MPYLPPLNLIRKKRIPGTWLPGWQFAVFQSPRVHGFTSAVRQMLTAMRNPFPWTNVSSGKKRLFCNLATRWNKILQFVPSFPIYGWLTWWCVFFPVGPAFEDHPQEFGQKKVQPLGFYFWHLRLGLFKSPFFWLVKLNICGCTLLQGQMHFQQKNICFVIWARWHEILEFVPSCPICGWLAWRCDFFPVGQPLKIIRKYSVKKGPAPWILFLTPAPWPLEVTFLVGEGEHM